MYCAELHQSHRFGIYLYIDLVDDGYEWLRGSESA